jgi:phytoene synthase
MLQESYGLAGEIMKNRAASFYTAFRHLPEERFRGVAAVYAFCRYADDTVDSESGDRELKLESLSRLEERLRRIYDPLTPEKDKPVNPAEELSWWPAFEDTVRRFDIPLGSFLQQIDGQRMDAAFEDIKTTSALVDYSRLVAGSVGTMMMPLLAASRCDTKNPGFIAACENLGIGMQITNILRDVGEDLRTRNRLYLPAELLEAYGVKRSALEALSGMAEGTPVDALLPEGFISLWEELARLADSFYRDYEGWIAWFHPGCRVPLVAAALIYRAIADAVRAEGYNCLTKRCYTNAETRALLIKEAGRRVRERSKPARTGRDST